MVLGGAAVISRSASQQESPTTLPASTPVAETQPVKPAVPEEPLDLIPLDNLLCWKGLPVPDADKQGDPSSLGVLLDLFGRLGKNPLGPEERLAVRILELLGASVRYPFAVSLIDAKAKPIGEDGSGSKVDRLDIAAVIKTDGDPSPFVRIIQKTVREMTDAGVATLEKQRAGKWDYQVLRDDRLPKWCVVAWGEIDDHYVITLGEGVWPLIASVASGETPSVGADSWFSIAREQRAEEPLIEVMVSANKIRERLDPFVGGRATAFFKSWGTEQTDRVHWAIGFKGAALYCVVNSRTGSSTQKTVYADPAYLEDRFKDVIPKDAHYAIYRVQVARFLQRLISSYYATRDEEDRRIASELWAKIQADLKIDAERDALQNLGARIVLHNYPGHPLHLPLAFTTLIEIKSEPQKVRQTLEKLCEAWRDGIEEAAAERGKPSPMQLYREDDGVWFIQFWHVAGLAWTFTDNYIVTSWSPKALRDYIEKYGDRLGKPR